MIDYTLPLDQLPDPLPIEPLRKPFDVTITPPGSKSITCRAYVLAALAQGESKIIRPLRADDTDHLLKALCTLGAEARWVPSETHDGEDVFIKGVGGRFPRGGNLYMGEGGTPTRFMIACACLAAEPVTIDASPRMRERPIAEGVDMLRQLGAKIEYVEQEGRLPVRVVPTDNFTGGIVRVGKTDSSQFISAMIIIGSSVKDGLILRYEQSLTSHRYVAMTYRMIREWGIRADHSFEDVSKHIISSGAFQSRQFQVEPDASSAVYWWMAAIIHPPSCVTVPQIGRTSNQPDSLFPKMFSPLTPLAKENWNQCTLAGPFVFPGSAIPCEDFPDCAVSLAVIAGRLQLPKEIKAVVNDVGTRTLTGLRTLRVKETDRIAALANELRKVGCMIETGEDWIAITPPVTNQDSHGRDARATDNPSATEPVVIETYNDHRMAMAFAVLGLNPPNGIPLAIRNPKCVAKSYPGFWKDFAKLYQ